MLKRSAFGLLLCAFAAVLHGEPATAPYAPAQLRFAEAELARANEARVRGDYALARSLAEQALLDARLAWSMSDSPHVRQAAAKVGEAAALLKDAGLRQPNHARLGGPHGVLIRP
jgi:hypothetical protein